MKGLDSAFIRWNDTHYAWEWVIYDEDGFDGRGYFAEADHNASDEELYLLCNYPAPLSASSQTDRARNF